MGFSDRRPSPLSGLATNDYDPVNHRRHASMPCTPPATPGGQFFDRSSPSTSTLHRRPPSISLTQASAAAYGGLPLSPPATPIRPTAYTSDKLELPSFNASPKGKGRGLHHRRISTATVMRALAAQGRLPAAAGGVIVTPSKVASWMVILLCTAYVGSFLHMPSPVDLFTSHHARAPLASSPARPLADGSSRRAWAKDAYRSSGQHAIPPHVPHLGPAGFDSNVLLDHPELFDVTRDQPARRLRKKPTRVASDERNAKAVAAAMAAVKEEAGAGATASPVSVKERESFAVHPDLLAESPNRKFVRPAVGGPGRAGPINRLHRAKKPAGAPAAAVVQAAPIEAAAEEAEEEPKAKAVPAVKKKKGSRKARKQDKELAKHAAHALARAAERRREKAAKSAPVVDWSLDGDADEGDE